LDSSTVEFNLFEPFVVTGETVEYDENDEFCVNKAVFTAEPCHLPHTKINDCPQSYLGSLFDGLLGIVLSALKLHGISATGV